MRQGPEHRRERREPVFDSGEPAEVGIRLSRSDRAGGAMAKPGRDDRGSRRSRRAPRRRSIIGRLISWTVVVAIWGMIGVAGLVAYHATQLPPIDQLAVPKRPPNVAILASDGSLLANRGETGGRTVSIKELPPYLPRAFVAIEDRPAQRVCCRPRPGVILTIG